MQKLDIQAIAKQFNIVDIKEFTKYVESNLCYDAKCNLISTPKSLAKGYFEKIEKDGHI